MVSLAEDVRVNAIAPERLRRLLGELEAAGRRNAYNIGGPLDTCDGPVRTLGVRG